MSCPGCSKPLMFIETCYDSDEESKLSYSCNTDDRECSIAIVYIHTMKKLKEEKDNG